MSMRWTGKRHGDFSDRPYPAATGGSLALFNTDVFDNLVISGSGANNEVMFDAFAHTALADQNLRNFVCNSHEGEDPKRVMNAALVAIPKMGMTPSILMGNGTSIRNNRRTGDRSVANLWLFAATVAYRLP